MPPSEKGPDVPKPTTDKPKPKSPGAAETAIGKGRGEGDTDPNMKTRIDNMLDATGTAAKKAATPPPEPPQIPRKPTPSEAAARTQEKVTETPWVPLVQVKPALEAEILQLIQLCKAAHDRARERKALAEGAHPETTKHWSQALLDLIKRLDTGVRKLPAGGERHAEMLTTLRGGIKSLYDRATVGETVLPEINTQNPTTAAAILYELTAHRSLGGKVVPNTLLESADYLMDSMGRSVAIGDGPYGRVPSSQASAFAKAAQLRMPVVKPEVGVVNKFVPWSELSQRMQMGANRIVQEGAYNQVLERAESDVKRAPSAQEPDAIRTKYDQDILDAIQLAEQSDFHRETPAAQRRAVQGRLETAKAALAKRGLVQPKAADETKKKP